MVLTAQWAFTNEERHTHAALIDWTDMMLKLFSTKQCCLRFYPLSERPHIPASISRGSSIMSADHLSIYTAKKLLQGQSEEH